MSNIESTPVEPYPWKRAEPFIPALSASLVIVPKTPIKAWHTDPHAPDGHWIHGLTIGGITLHTGMGEAQALVVIDRLSEALRELRDDIVRRIEIATNGPLPTADDVLGILAEKPALA